MASGIVAPTKCVIYCRFSDRRNAEDCLSNDTQLHYCREYAQQHGYSVVNEYSDEAVSGGDEERPGLWAAMAALKRGMVLLAYKYDRLARSVYLDELLHREARAKGARIEVVDGTRNDTPGDRLVRQIMAAVAEFERQAIAARTKAAMLHMQYNCGRRVGGIIPFGYKAAGSESVNGRVVKKICQDDGEQAVLARIRQLREEGVSYREIAGLLEGEGHTCRGNKWLPKTLQRLCKRQVVA